MKYLLDVIEMISYNGKSYERGNEWTERFDSDKERQDRFDELIPEEGCVYPSPLCEEDHEWDIHDEEDIWILTVKLTEEEEGS